MKNKRKYKRLRVFADAQTQTALCIRIVVYWFVCQLSVIAPICLLAGLDGADASITSATRFIIPALIVSCCVLPLVLVDQLVFSNRFAGPLRNFRGKFSRLVNDGEVEEIFFRGGDYYPDLQENYNKLCRDIEFSREVQASKANQPAAGERPLASTS